MSAVLLLYVVGLAFSWAHALRLKRRRATPERCAWTWKDLSDGAHVRPLAVLAWPVTWLSMLLPDPPK